MDALKRRLGSIVAQREGLDNLIWRDRVELWQQDRPVRKWDEPPPADGLVAMHQDFARTVRTHQPPRSTPAGGLAGPRLIMAMLRSSETVGTVRVAEVA